MFIVCYIDDHTRVTLENIDGIPESDYINANHIDVSTMKCFKVFHGKVSVFAIV